MTKLEHDRQTNHHRAVEGGGKVRGMKEILAAIDEGGERGLDLSNAVCTSALYNSSHVHAHVQGECYKKVQL